MVSRGASEPDRGTLWNTARERGPQVKGTPPERGRGDEGPRVTGDMPRTGELVNVLAGWFSFSP